jgi:hypothetical protein
MSPDKLIDALLSAKAGKAGKALQTYRGLLLAGVVWTVATLHRLEVRVSVLETRLRPIALQGTNSLDIVQAYGRDARGH